MVARATIAEIDFVEKFVTIYRSPRCRETYDVVVADLQVIGRI
jgi:hypothetical protein